MLKKPMIAITAGLLSLSLFSTAYGAEQLAAQGSLENVEAAVKTIRGIYNTTNSGSYSVENNQWFRQSGSDKQVVKALVSNGDPALDQIMRENGYKTYAVEYYYGNPDYTQQAYSGSPSLNFAFARIDGREYRYYFSGSSLIRRIGPDGAVTDNPTVNPFLNRLYQVGCRMENDLSVCSQRSLSHQVIYFTDRHYDMGTHLELYAYVMENDGSLPDSAEYNLYIVDGSTKISADIETERTWQKGDNGYTWMSRHLQTDVNDGGYMSSLECFQISTTGSHVDSIEGIYATH